MKIGDSMWENLTKIGVLGDLNHLYGDHNWNIWYFSSYWKSRFLRILLKVRLFVQTSNQHQSSIQPFSVHSIILSKMGLRLPASTSSGRIPDLARLTLYCFRGEGWCRGGGGFAASRATRVTLSSWREFWLAEETKRLAEVLAPSTMEKLQI